MGTYGGFLGRLLLSSVFLISAIAKAAHFTMTAEELDGFGLPAARLALALAIAVELTGGTLLLAGLRTRKTAWALTLYVLLVTVVMHIDIRDPLNAVFAVTNVGLLGGLLILAARGAPELSLDAYLARHGGKVILDTPAGT